MLRYATPKRSGASRLFGHDIFLSFALGPPPRGTHSNASDLARRLRAALLHSKIIVVIANLGIHAGMAFDERRGYLRGLEIEQSLKARGRLPPNQDWIVWFEERLKELDGG